MSKYFIQDEDIVKVRLSDYLKKCPLQEQKRVRRIISVLGDVSLTHSEIAVFVTQVNAYMSLHVYDKEDELLKEIYKFTSKFPQLSFCSVLTIADRYEKDIFEDYHMAEILEELIIIFGIEDITFEMFEAYLREKSTEVSNKIMKEALIFEKYRDSYSCEETTIYDYIRFLTHCAVYEHIKVDKLLESMPSPEIIKKDIKFRSYVFQKYGTALPQEPISFMMTRSLAKEESMDIYGEQPKYCSLAKIYVDAPFTTQEFLDSIDLEKTKELIKEPESFHERMIKKYGKK